MARAILGARQHREAASGLDTEANVARARRRVAEIKAQMAQLQDGTSDHTLQQRLLTAETLLEIVTSPGVIPAWPLGRPPGREPHRG